MNPTIVLVTPEQLEAGDPAGAYPVLEKLRTGAPSVEHVAGGVVQTVWHLASD